MFRLYVASIVPFPASCFGGTSCVPSIGRPLDTRISSSTLSLQEVKIVAAKRMAINFLISEFLLGSKVRSRIQFGKKIMRALVLFSNIFKLRLQSYTNDHSTKD